MQIDTASLRPSSFPYFKEVLGAQEVFQMVLKSSWIRRVLEVATLPPSDSTAALFGGNVTDYRDLEWERVEQPYFQLALQELNTNVTIFNAQVPATCQIPYYGLEAELTRIFEESVNEIMDALSGLALRKALHQSSLSGEYKEELTKQVKLPLEALEGCSICKGIKHLRLCASCGERVYCSKECQRQDWSNHKLTCGQTDKLDLHVFYPFIATLTDSLRMGPERPMQIGTAHKVLDVPAVRYLPDGTLATVITMGDYLPDPMADRNWWAAAKLDSQIKMLYTRMERAGYLLPLLIAVCFSMLSEIYTTPHPTSIHPPASLPKRTRFCYHGCPIVDFGIAKGTLDLPPQARLAYLSKENELLPPIQDIDEHYWIYFRTLSGEDVIVDCGLYTFGIGASIEGLDYKTQDMEYLFPAVPVIFEDKDARRRSARFRTEQGRVSVLRNADLHGAIKIGTEDPIKLWNFMGRVAGREPKEREKYLLRTWVHRSCRTLQTVVKNQMWTSWPKEPTHVGEDPETGSVYLASTVQDEELANDVKRINKRYNRGQIGAEEYTKANREATWRARQRARQKAKRS